MDTQEADSSTSQNLVFLNSHANSVYLHSCQRPAPVTDTLLRQEGMYPLTRASTVVTSLLCAVDY